MWIILICLKVDLFIGGHLRGVIPQRRSVCIPICLYMILWLKSSVYQGVNQLSIHVCLLGYLYACSISINCLLFWLLQKAISQIFGISRLILKVRESYLSSLFFSFQCVDLLTIQLKPNLSESIWGICKKFLSDI